MKNLNKIYFRSTKNILDRYPNWPIIRNIDLGLIGFYHGRNADFQWVTSLEELGISFKTRSSESSMNELYTSMDSVSVKFEASEKMSSSKAKFKFGKKNKIALQGHKMFHQQIEISDLNKSLIEKINEGLKWNYKWIILSEIWVADGFTTLISGSQNGICEISTLKNTDKGDVFNIANVTLGLNLSNFSNMAYQGVAEQNVKPYLQILKLTSDNHLKRYGKNIFF